MSTGTEAGTEAPFSRDFERLEVGTRVATPGRTITEADLVSFSALTGDWHPQHADASWAAESRFGERIAHGMMVVSYAIGLLPIDPERVAALRGLSQVVFKRPVPIGETIRVDAEVAAKKPLDADHGLVTLAVRIKSPEGRLLTRLAIDAVWRREAAEVAGAEENGGAGSVEAEDGEAAPGNPAAGAGGTDDPATWLSPVGDGRVLI